MLRKWATATGYIPKCFAFITPFDCYYKALAKTYRDDATTIAFSNRKQNKILFMGDVACFAIALLKTIKHSTVCSTVFPYFFLVFCCWLGFVAFWEIWGVGTYQVFLKFQRIFPLEFMAYKFVRKKGDNNLIQKNFLWMHRFLPGECNSSIGKTYNHFTRMMHLNNTIIVEIALYFMKIGQFVARKQCHYRVNYIASEISDM